MKRHHDFNGKVTLLPFQRVWDYKGQCQHIGPPLPEPSGQNNPVLTSTSIGGNRRSYWIAGADKGNCDQSPTRSGAPIGKFAFKAHALRDSECRDDAQPDCLPDFPAVSHVRQKSLRDW